MIVQLVRTCPETNSSSSHFVVFDNEKQNKIPRFLRLIIRHSLEFGWYDYDKINDREIIEYFYVQSLHNKCDKYFINLLKKRGVLRYFEDNIGGHYVDHQSVIRIVNLPPNIKAQFLVELCLHVLKHGRIVISSDNICNDDVKYQEDKVNRFKHISLKEFNDDVHVYRNGNYWILLEEDTNGLYKYYMSFNEDTKLISVYPEQIDIKITNMCEHNCKFCHENSIPTGNHGDVNILYDLLMTSYGYMIPEITLGGGNVLLHPDLKKLLKMIVRNESFVSFTVNWKDLEKYGDYIIELMNIGKRNDRSIHHVNLGISVSPYYLNCNENNYLMGTLKMFIDKMRNNDLDYFNLVYHFVDGICDTNQVYNFIKEYIDKYYRINVLILGYKNVGRGEKFHPNKHINIVELYDKVSKLNEYIDETVNIYVDEVYVENYLEYFNLDIYPVNKVPNDYEEQKYNLPYIFQRDIVNTTKRKNVILTESFMYFDLVTMKYAKNSDIDKDDMFNYNEGESIEFIYNVVNKQK